MLTQGKFHYSISFYRNRIYLLIPSARWPRIYCPYQTFFNTECVLILELINHMKHKVVWKMGPLSFRGHCL